MLHTVLVKELKKEWNNEIPINYIKVNNAMNKLLSKEDKNNIVKTDEKLKKYSFKIIN